MLLHRLLIGAIIGGMHARSKLDDATVAQVEGELVDEEVNGSVLQTSLLICVSGFLLGYIVYVRPYLVPLANFFEALIVLAQVICLFMNFFFIDEGGVFGIELRPEVAARVIYYTMMTSVACLLLRMIAVMLPTWRNLPHLVHVLITKVPAWRRKKRAHDQRLRHMERVMQRRKSLSNATAAHAAHQRATKEKFHRAARKAKLARAASNAFMAFGASAGDEVERMQKKEERAYEKLRHKQAEERLAEEAQLLAKKKQQQKNRRRRHKITRTTSSGASNGKGGGLGTARGPRAVQRTTSGGSSGLARPRRKSSTGSAGSRTLSRSKFGSGLGLGLEPSPGSEEERGDGSSSSSPMRRNATVRAISRTRSQNRVLGRITEAQNEEATAFENLKFAEAVQRARAQEALVEKLKKKKKKKGKKKRGKRRRKGMASHSPPRQSPSAGSSPSGGDKTKSRRGRGKRRKSRFTMQERAARANQKREARRAAQRLERQRTASMTGRQRRSTATAAGGGSGGAIQRTLSAIKSHHDLAEIVEASDEEDAQSSHREEGRAGRGPGVAAAQALRRSSVSSTSSLRSRTFRLDSSSSTDAFANDKDAQRQRRVEAREKRLKQRRGSTVSLARQRSATMLFVNGEDASGSEAAAAAATLHRRRGSRSSQAVLRQRSGTIFANETHDEST